MLHVPLNFDEAWKLRMLRMKPSSFKKPKMRSSSASSAEPSWMFHPVGSCWKLLPNEKVECWILDILVSGIPVCKLWQLWIRFFG